jgi:predicted AAA+ superfamily ATPase
MLTISRAIEKQLSRAAKAFSAVVVTGPRRSGKTWLLRHQFPKAQHFLFEDPDVIGRFRTDPQGFLDGVTPPVILDEIQNVPEVFNFVRSRIDQNPGKKGQWLLTGSQESSLMQNVSESMAGRAAILQMLPLSLSETPKVSLLRGGYPEVILRPNAAALWFSSYTQTYLERDVRNASAILSLETFRRFMSLLATRHGAVLNMSEFSAPLGVSVPTVSRWLDILETSGLILRLPPFFENIGKRLIKAPKIYWLDSGLVCHLLGIRSSAELERSPFLGAIFEGAVASEIIKSQVNQGQRRALYYFRDQQGLEVDFIKLNDGGTATFIEAKATRSPQPSMLSPMIRLIKAWHDTAQQVKLTPSILVHRAAKNAIESAAIAPGCRAMTFEKFAEHLG